MFQYLEHPAGNLSPLFEASRWLKGMKVFVISGGGQLDDYWGGSWHHPYTLFMWARLAKLRGVKFIMV